MIRALRAQPPSPVAARTMARAIFSPPAEEGSIALA
jgi:hypothetical protein